MVHLIVWSHNGSVNVSDNGFDYTAVKTDAGAIVSVWSPVIIL